jgi:hypothetical protein
MKSPRNFGVTYQGTDERVAYTLNTTNWGGYTSGAACVIKDESGKVTTSTNLSGSASETGGVITSPLVISLTAGVKYRLEFLWVYSGNTFEAYLEIIGEQ